MRIRPTVVILSLALATAAITNAQEATPPPTQPPLTPPAQQTPPPVATAARSDAFPNVNVYLPEGQASIRLRKLIKNVLFESQIDYRFVNGDISTFLRGYCRMPGVLPMSPIRFLAGSCRRSAWITLPFPRSGGAMVWLIFRRSSAMNDAVADGVRDSFREMEAKLADRKSVV